MLEILLIRHGQTDWNRDRRIMGRKPVPLNKAGRAEARALAKALKGVKIDALYTSPVLRAVETAEHLRDGRKTAIRHAQEMAEIDYGRWIGKTFEEVIPEKAFRVYHKTPRKAQAPGGERMRDVYRRTIRFIETIRRRHKAGRIAVVSHADVIKTVLVHYLGMDYDHLLKFRIDNASISLLWFYKDRARVMAVNALAAPHKLFGLVDLLSPNVKAAPIRKARKKNK
ncbi:MAG TPA: histidine phosphatase family protein [bacterium]|nr:histidine phosphatase family protein [bacterium]